MFFDSTQDTDEVKDITHKDLSFDDINRMFLEESDDNKVIKSTAQVEGYLFAINKLKDEIENLKALKKQSAEFYDQKIESTDNTIEMLKVRIEIFMNTTDNKRIPTQAGTVFFTTRKKETLPDDDVLLKYSETYAIEPNVKVTPDKRAIKAFIKDGGAVPEGYSVEEVTNLSIRK
jgi:hypothetical protein